MKMSERRLTAERRSFLAEYYAHYADHRLPCAERHLLDAIHDLDAAEREIESLQGCCAEGVRAITNWEKLKARLREAKLSGGGRPDEVMLTTIDAVQEMMDELEGENG